MYEYRMYICMYQWCEFKSHRGKNKNLTAQNSNSNTVWFNFQTYIYIYIYQMHYPLRSQCSGTDVVYKIYLLLKFTVPYKKRRYLNKCSQCDYIENVNVKPSE